MSACLWFAGWWTFMFWIGVVMIIWGSLGLVYRAGRTAQ